MSQSPVYLIDDEPELVEVLSEAVRLVGLDPIGFTRATHFFEQVTEFETGSILVLDLNMPEMDGIEVMRRLAVQGSSPAIILMSGHDINVLHSAEKLSQAHNLELIASMSKPIQLDEFQDMLEQHKLKVKGSYPAGVKTGNNAIGASELLFAIRNDQLTLQYQPQIDIASGKTVGAEALVRWQHPKSGLIFPDDFINMAEQTGVIGELTHWVIDNVIQQYRKWLESGFSITISANISAKDITSLTLPEQLVDSLADSKFDLSKLTLELTEGALMGELVTSLDILTRLRLKGLGLSIDDFGTGYSSLSLLHRVPFTELKVDRSFVSNMVEDAEARAIVKTCIILGHELNLLVVAEGVETVEQLELLKQMNCDKAQGNYFSKPVDAETLQLQFFACK